MQTQKFIIRGSYYDSQIYSGLLYLWSTRGSIIIVDWDRLIESIRIEDRLRLALRCAFQQSEYLYKPELKLIYQDEEVKKVIQQKFLDLREKTIEFSEEELLKRGFIMVEQDNPFPFPHADSLIYSNTLYVASPSDISATALNKKSRNPVNSNSARLWDGPVLGVAASYGVLALSAGNEGLFQRSCYTESSQQHEEPTLISHEPSNSARWMYASIFSSSYFNNGYLAYFTMVQEEEKSTERVGEESASQEETLAVQQMDVSNEAKLEVNTGEISKPKQRERRLREIVSSDSIFERYTNNGSSAYTWGVHDKICMAKPDRIEVVHYGHNSRDVNRRFSYLGRVRTPFRNDSERDHSDFTGDIVRGVQPH